MTLSTGDIPDALAETTFVETDIPYLARDERFKHEKPYGADFPVEEIDGASITNYVFDTHSVSVHDVRSLAKPLNLDSNGACFLKAKTSLKYNEASNYRTPAMQQYMEEIVAILQQRFSHYVEIKIRWRSTAFPNGYGQKVAFSQPATLPHTDFSVQGAYMWMRDIFPEQVEDYKRRSFDLLNVWKVLKGPNNDWPLAVCDYMSIDVNADTTTNDALHQRRTGENWLLYPSDKHRWFYQSSMEEDDLIIFRNTDSDGVRSRCFHAAFEHPKSTSDPRHSIKMRVVAFRN